ncbi:MAG: Co2+/Mg2+ efflux protein ApaG [Gammaproteobacteria bacterium]
MRDLRYQVDVNAQATYIESQSNPSDSRFVFTYTDTIANNGTMPAQLLHRYWKITDGEGGIREVHGDGVVGEQPTIVPGDEFTYTSGAILETAIATMEGYFEMVAADGELFKAKIPIFTLLNPRALH